HLRAGEDEEADPVPADLAVLLARDQHPGEPDRDIEMASQLEQRPRAQRVIDGLEPGRRPPVSLAQAAERLLHLPELGVQRLNRIRITAHPCLPCRYPKTDPWNQRQLPCLPWRYPKTDSENQRQVR